MQKPAEDGRFDRAAALFIAVDKALRTMRLYEGQGALLDRQLDELALKATAATAEGELTVKVGSVGLSLAGKPLSVDDKRQPHLFRLFCDGVRELTLLQGIEREELRALLSLLGRDTRSSDEDMVTRLWQANLHHVRHYAVDSFTAGVAVDTEVDLTLLQTSGARIDRGSEGQATTLSSDDIRLLRGEDRLRWIKGAMAPGRLNSSDVEELRGLLQAPPDLRRFLDIGLRAAERHHTETGAMEASPFLLGQLDGMVAAGSAPAVGAMLAAIAEARSASAAGAVLLAAVAQPERMMRLKAVVLSQPSLFRPFFLAAAHESREGSLALLKLLPAGLAQAELHRALTDEGVDLTPLFVARLASETEAEVLEAIVSLGSLGTPDALRGLTGPLKSTSTTLRNAALTALAGRYVADLRTELGRLLRDPSREIRLQSLAILRGSADARMGYHVLAAVEDASFAGRDVEEQEALYAALAALHDNRTLGHFQAALQNKNLFRARGVVARQLLCVKGLATTGTPEARALLENFRSAWYLPQDVRSAIRAALGSR